ncbi:uncharacterized oxidoreductase YjmC-like [Periplaneta americana]|uniref:uncharacterized oxidoreductase YjmC-like n=1 Tax=Periplaneta americana TaxID=6978 RepID=UPI0037E76F70
MSTESEGHFVSLQEVSRFCMDALVNIGVNVEFAQQMADMLVAADYRGHYSCGLKKLGIHVEDIKRKVCNGNARPTILRETAATAWVDGNNGMGPVVGNFCMDIAIQKAKKSGIGWVVAKGSNDFGIAMWYSRLALEHDMVGMAFSNTPPVMAPTRAKQAALGSNPISMAAPGLRGDSFILDMATTAASLQKIEMYQRRQEPIPNGWALDSAGRLTTDPNVALETGCLMPLGGLEDTSGHKGYGLALMVETLCGILGGAAYGPYIKKEGDYDRPANLGQCFVAINPECFAPGFKERMSDLMNTLRAMEPADPRKPVLVPGDPERLHMLRVDKQGGILYSENQIKALMDVANELKIQPLNIL